MLDAYLLLFTHDIIHLLVVLVFSAKVAFGLFQAYKFCNPDWWLFIVPTTRMVFSSPKVESGQKVEA